MQHVASHYQSEQAGPVLFVFLYLSSFIVPQLANIIVLLIYKCNCLPRSQRPISPCYIGLTFPTQHVLFC